jgi:hypothetical protein
VHPASTSLTGTNHPVNARGGPVRRGRSRRSPGHAGQPEHPGPKEKRT